MKDLYKYIEESILNSDEKITQDLVGDEATAKLHYQLFMKYVGDLLYKKSPYSFFPSFDYIDFELGLSLQSPNCSPGYMYDKCEKALIKYFEELKKIHNKTYTVKWSRRVGHGYVAYEISLKNKNTGNIRLTNFVINNYSHTRKIHIVWKENKPFMLP